MKAPVTIEGMDRWLAKRCEYKKESATTSMKFIASNNRSQLETHVQVSLMAFAGIGITVAVGLYRMRWSSRLNRGMSNHIIM